MKLSLLIVGITLAIITGESLFAATQSNVTLERVNINKPLGNLVFIRTSQPPTPSGCHTDTNWNFVMPYDSELDKAMYSMLLSAMASNMTVELHGSGSCSVPSIETLVNIHLHK